MSISSLPATLEYVLDMLGQLSQLAKRDGLGRLAGRIDTVIAAERADAGIAAKAPASEPPPDSS